MKTILQAMTTGVRRLLALGQASSHIDFEDAQRGGDL